MFKYVIYAVAFAIFTYAITQLVYYYRSNNASLSNAREESFVVPPEPPLDYHPNPPVLPDTSNIGREMLSRSRISKMHDWICTIHDKQSIISYITNNPSAVTSKDELRLTALHWACRLGKKEAVIGLIEQHADVNAVADSSEIGNETPVAFLMDSFTRPAVPNQPSDDLDYVRAMMKSGATMSDVELPLVYTEIAEILLSNGANPNAQNNIGNTPVIKAVMNGNSAILRVLLQHGGNPSIANSYGMTAITVAKSITGRPDIQKLIDSHKIIKDD